MSQTIKRLPPDLPASFVEANELTGDILALLSEGEDVEGVRFTGVTFDALPGGRASFRGCAFEKCAFPPREGADIRYDFLDCAFTRCDLAGARFDRGALQRVTFRGSRGVGLYMPDALLRNVAFDDCQLGYLNLGGAKLTNVEFTACDLGHASFGYAALKGVAFSACRLSGAELFGVQLKGMDLRTNEIDGIVLSDRMELEGAIVTPLQACALAHLLGVIVEG